MIFKLRKYIKKFNRILTVHYCFILNAANHYPTLKDQKMTVALPNPNFPECLFLLYIIIARLFFGCIRFIMDEKKVLMDAAGIADAIKTLPLFTKGKPNVT
jgi:hypothetical protein